MKRPELLVTNGELEGRRFPVPEGGLRLGRSSSNDIHVPDEKLSRNHCLFEPVGESGIRVTDLASANGTLVNGRMLAADPALLRVGDRIEVGEIVLTVVGETPVAPGPVDLGLDKAKSPEPQSRRRSPLANILWGVAVLVAAVAVYVVLMTPRQVDQAVPTTVADDVPTVCEVQYEKVEATLESVYRYEMTVSPDKTIRVVLDDTRENRHPTIEPRKLDERAMEELNAMLPFEKLRELDSEYVGPEPEPQAMNSWRLKVVYSTRVKSVRIVNAQEPESFRAIREKLEAFSNNELGIRAIQYSREKLVSLAEDQIAVGKAKWEDRDVQHGNLFAAVGAYREALFYLETIDPKPACVAEARRGLDETQAELNRRYGEQRFVVDRAIKLENWESAQRELTVLLEMIPDRKDDRNREASAKLIDVEKRLKGGK